MNENTSHRSSVASALSSLWNGGSSEESDKSSQAFGLVRCNDYDHQ